MFTAPAFQSLGEHFANSHQVDETATAILKKKKKPNSLMYVFNAQHSETIH
jgi:hypothetical protein